MDDFTALHRHLGRPRGPVDDGLLDVAKEAHLEETDDLDWKQELPPMKGLGKTDFPKDIAAFANAGGGTIVYGFTEEDMAAVGRMDAGECTEADLRTMRATAAARIFPPVLGLRIHRLDKTPERAVVVVVPPSLDRPHAIMCDHQRYGYPLRNGADTDWMSERAIAEQYRYRFTEQRNSLDAIDRLFEGAQVDIASGQRAWAFAVARPRLPIAGPANLSSDDVKTMINTAKDTTRKMLRRDVAQPLHGVDYLNIRPGLRRWTARARLALDPSRHAWTSVHQDGAVTLSTALLGNPANPGSRLPELDPAQVPTARLEALVANLISLVSQIGSKIGVVEYEVRLGLAWPRSDELKFLPFGEDSDLVDLATVPMLERFDPVEATVTLDAGEGGILNQIRALATDCVNQGGVDHLVALKAGSLHPSLRTPGILAPLICGAASDEEALMPDSPTDPRAGAC